MPNLTSVTITNGVPTAGSGTVSTLDALMADGGQATLGAKADAAVAATDTTAVSAISIWKQISKSIQLFVFGAGTAAAAQRTTLASDDPLVAVAGAKADAASAATDTTSISIMSVLKQVSKSVQLMVYGAGTAAAAQRTTLASDDPAVAALGGTTGAKVITDANGTIQQYLRGLVSQWIANTLTFASQAHSCAVTFTPAASSHSANNCNGVAGNFTSMGLSGKPVLITSASLLINGGTAEATAWRLYLYNVTPPSATADAGAWDLPSGDQASFLGYIDLGTAVDLGSTQWVETNGLNKQIQLSGTGFFAYLVNLTTLTPAAVAHIVTLHTVEL